MKVGTEIKIALIGIATILALIWGINYLKGKNIFKSTYTLNTFLSESGGIEPSSPVLLNGAKIGFVDQVLLRTLEPMPIQVTLEIEKIYPLYQGAKAELFSADLIGTKAIRINQTDQFQELADGDTIPSVMSPDLLGSLQQRIFPILEQVSLLARSVDSLVGQAAGLMGHEGLPTSLENLSSITGSLRLSLSQGGSLDMSLQNLEEFTSMLADQNEAIAVMISNLSSLSAELDTAGIGELVRELGTASRQFNALLYQVNSGEGSAGRLFYTDSLHNQLVTLVTDLDLLVKDLNENPGDYVHLSVFGKSTKKDP
jgi:phospholipid/cholesterol/gamma-HCH transport system substrate-binding protein